MARILPDVSRTFAEYLLLPGLSRREHIPRNVSLAAPMAAFQRGETSRFQLNVPVVSASMQAVSGAEMATALARQGGLAFVFCSQSIENQAAMIAKVKAHKAGFVRSDTTIHPASTLRELLAIRRRTGHSTAAVTDDGTNAGKFVGIITDKRSEEHTSELQSQR